MSLQVRWQYQLDALRRQGRYRRLASPVGIDFSSNDYLGYAGLSWPELSDFSRSGAASRLLRGHHPIWDEVENSLAHWHGAEASLMFTSGYAANEGLLSTVIEPGDWVASDDLNHASIIDGLRLAKAERFVFRHNDVTHLEEGLRLASTMGSPSRQLFLVTESLYGMEGDFVAPAVAELVERFDVNWIVDEAHATGCLGPSGAGLIEQNGWRRRVLASVHTGGKALGLPGAYVCCSQTLRDLLVNRCRHFIFTTAMPPQVGAWWRDVVPHVQADHAARQALSNNAAFFLDALAHGGVATRSEGYIVSIVLGEDAAATEAAAKLQREGFDIRAIRPPTVPEGTARLRVSIHADHDRRALGSVAELISRLVK